MISRLRNAAGLNFTIIRKDASAAYQMIQPRLTLAAHLFVMAVRTFL
jgi:hypothetical protein